MIKVLDLFCGAGGFSLGFEQNPEMKVILAIDLAPTVLKAYQFNFPDTKILQEDISQLRSEDMLDVMKTAPDVIIASPPCEAYSNANPTRKPEPLMRLYDDPVGRLTLHAIRIIGDLQPFVFVLENVPQLMEGDLQDALKFEFARVGYRKIHFNIIHAERHGCPSQRSRLFLSNIPLNLPKRPAPSTMQVLRTIPDPRTIHDLPNHDYIPLSEKKNKKIRMLRTNSSLIYYKAAKKINTNWKRLAPNKPCFTIMGNSRYIHPTESRLLTVREQARLMTWPDQHVFLGSQSEQFNQVGEAVPPLIANDIANLILKKELTDLKLKINI
ncbi:MAG: DNA cytosine methyltransferase [Candidatus Helarchaeales archaeon]